MSGERQVAGIGDGDAGGFGEGANRRFGVGVGDWNQCRGGDEGQEEGKNAQGEVFVVPWVIPDVIMDTKTLFTDLFQC